MAEGQLHWDSNILNHLTVCKQMRSHLCKNKVHDKLFAYKSYIWTGFGIK